MRCISRCRYPGFDQYTNMFPRRNLIICVWCNCTSSIHFKVDYYDFVLAIDRPVRDRLLSMAEAAAHTDGAHLYDWERKIRLLCDFDNACDSGTRRSRAGSPLDVPSFSGESDPHLAMDIIQDGCTSVMRTLMSVGL